ncbi:MAG TPA: sugar phosphate isomerase/epimerase [Vicinamibacterales bacterium]|nr:sugar phosphate isomerase/epimerase [Vicinamibacterales bacterium]
MRRLTRREFNGLAAAAFAAAPLAPRLPRRDSKIAGVRIGAQTYSFRDRSLDATIQAMASIGLSYCELWSPQVESRDIIVVPAGANRRQATRKWRLETPLDFFAGVRRKFSDAGITLTAYNLSFESDWTDEEIARGFEMATALGVNVITASSPVSLVRRIDPHAKRTGITVAFHNHSEIGPDQFATAADFATAMKGASDRIAINLDIGHFTAANFDPVPFLDEHHDRIVSLHIKDRKKNQGANVPFGEGDTPIIPVLRRLRDRKWDIPAQLEYEYKGTDAVTEVARCLEYCRRALLA